MSAIARNAPCPCGSGKKHKRCCGDPAVRSARETEAAERLRRALEQHHADTMSRIEARGRSSRRRALAAVFGAVAVVAP